MSACTSTSVDFFPQRKCKTARCDSCHVEFQYWKNLPKKYCEGCGVAAKRKVDSASAERRRRQQGMPSVKGTVVKCLDCSSHVQRGSHGTNLVRCEICGPVARRKYTTEANRVRSEALKAKRLAAGLPVAGDLIQCSSCPDQFPYTSGWKRLRCDPCSLTENLERAKLSSKRKSRSLGRPEIGDPINCEDCFKSFPLSAPGHKICKLCARKRILKTKAKRAKARRRSDNKWALNQRLRTAMRRGLTERKPRGSLERLVGWTIDQLIKHLERQFLEGMSWSNMHLWHVDHRVPLASFSFTTNRCPEFKAAWALTNLQPLWDPDNRAKSDKRLFLL